MKKNVKHIHTAKKKNRKELWLISFFLLLLTNLILIFFFLFGTITVICVGPSTAARDIFVNTVMESSAAKFLAHIYFSNDQINEILASNNAKPDNTLTDTSSVVISSEEEALVSQSDIIVEDIKGSTFIGKMMIISDPTRIFVATVPNFNNDSQGKLLSDMIVDYDAAAGINAGGFLDVNGTGKGGMPLGVVIQNGVITCDTSPNTADTVIGFDVDHKLMIGNMTGQQAINNGMIEGVSFGPALVLNGERVPIPGSGGGLNPRTAIGQRQDGAVLFLVIDGRQVQSLGASYKDLASVMLEYGAVNAGNLDGGSSSMMIYNGEVLNHHSTLIGPRKIPTAFLVKKVS